MEDSAILSYNTQHQITFGTIALSRNISEFSLAHEFFVNLTTKQNTLPYTRQAPSGNIHTVNLD